MPSIKAFAPASRKLRVVGLLHDRQSLHLTLVHTPDADAAVIATAATAAGFTVLSATQHATAIQGLHKHVQALLGVALHQVECDATGAHFFMHLMDVDIPAALAPHVDTVLGLNSFPAAKPRALGGKAPSRAPVPVTYRRYLTPATIRASYGLPDVDASTGAGITVGIIELGGGYTVADLNSYIATYSPHASSSQVSSVSVQGAVNNTSDTSGASYEVALDIELVLGMAPGATIKVYFAPNTDAGFLAAIARAGAECDIVSISWAASENYWSPSALASYNTVLRTLSTNQITVFAASGDNGAKDGQQRGLHVEFPGSSPNVVACGGTSVLVPVTGTAIAVESVWNDSSGASGGGFSAVFSKPSYQTGVLPRTQSKRGVPDVSANADPVTGHPIVINGRTVIIGGTSAVAPMYAGALAQLYTLHPSMPRMGSLDFLARCYTTPSKFNDIVKGNNGGFNATYSWDPCTGLGRLNSTFFA